MNGNDDIRTVRDLLAGRRSPDSGEVSGLERAWRDLDLPPPAAAPPGFARRVTARAAAESEAVLGLPMAPRLARLAAALALVAGTAAGAGLGLLVASPAAEAEDELAWAADESFAAEFVDSLATLASAGAGEEGEP